MYVCYLHIPIFYECIYVYPHGSPIPATSYQGLLRPRGSQLLECGPPQASPNYQNGNKRPPIQEQFMTKQCWGEYWCLFGELQAPKRHQIPKCIKNVQKSTKLSIHRDSNLRIFLWHSKVEDVNWHTYGIGCFGTLLLRFFSLCGGARMGVWYVFYKVKHTSHIFG